MDPINRWIYNIIDKIPKRVKEDITYITYYTSTAGLYVLSVIAAGVLVYSALTQKGCSGNDNKQESRLESTINESVK